MIITLNYLLIIIVIIILFCLFNGNNKISIFIYNNNVINVLTYNAIKLFMVIILLNYFDVLFCLFCFLFAYFFVGFLCFLSTRCKKLILIY